MEPNMEQLMISEMIVTLKHAFDVLQAKQKGEKISEEDERMSFHLINFLSKASIAYIDVIKAREIIQQTIKGA